MRNHVRLMLTMTPVIWFVLVFWNERTACYDSTVHRLTVKFLSQRLLRHPSFQQLAQPSKYLESQFISKFVNSIRDIRDLHPKSTYFVASADIVWDEGS